MGMDGECLGCGVEFDYGEEECPECGWDLAAFRERDRHGLAKDGHGEPDDEGDGGPPPGPGSLRGI